VFSKCSSVIKLAALDAAPSSLRSRLLSLVDARAGA
jgi:hypothetical protein